MNSYRSLRRHLVAIPFELIMLGGAAVTFAAGNWKHLAASLFTFAVSFAPLLFERWFRIKLPASVQFLYVAFVFASMFSGEVLGMYNRLWAWDDSMHFISGLLVGLAVILWLVWFARHRKKFVMPVWFEILTILYNVVMVAVLWEVAEFTSDQLFGTFSQGNNLQDTMWDLVYALESGLIMGVAWMFHIKSKHFFIVSAIIKQFKRLNP